MVRLLLFVLPLVASAQIVLKNAAGEVTSTLSHDLTQQGIVHHVGLHIECGGACGESWSASVVSGTVNDIQFVNNKGSFPGALGIGYTSWQGMLKAAGTYQYTIRITDSGASNSPQHITLTVTLHERIHFTNVTYPGTVSGCTNSHSDYVDADTCTDSTWRPDSLAFSVPPDGNTYTDANFGSTVRVVTSASHEYSQPSPMNRDRTKILVQRSGVGGGGVRDVVNAVTGATVVADIPGSTRCMFWDRDQDNVYYRCSEKTLQKVTLDYDLGSYSTSTFADFSSHFPNDYLGSGAIAEIVKTGYVGFYSSAVGDINGSVDKMVCILRMSDQYIACADGGSIAGPAITQWEGSFLSKGRDVDNGKSYFWLSALPACAIWSFDNLAASPTLSFELRCPRDPDGRIDYTFGTNAACTDTGQGCIAAPHADLYEDLDGRQYFCQSDDLNASVRRATVCHRFSAGLLMRLPIPEGGGLQIVRLDHRGGETWASHHIGCATDSSWCVYSTFPTPRTSRNISGATNASPIEITTTSNHPWSTGQKVNIGGVLGNTAANGIWNITVTSSTTFTLDGSASNGTYTSGGVVGDGAAFNQTPHMLEATMFQFGDAGHEIRRVLRPRTVPYQGDGGGGYWVYPRCALSRDASQTICDVNFGEPSLVKLVTTETEVVSSQPTISNISRSPSREVEQWAKCEFTFDLETTATNLYWPYDSSPPPGIAAGLGVSAVLEISPDDWQTTHSVPAFYFQEFDEQEKGGREWFYPTATYRWKARVAFPTPGTWKYRLRAEDSSGSTQSDEGTVTVASSQRRGPVRVSSADPRYFEHADGFYFPGLGYNMNFDALGWNNPILDNDSNIRTMGGNGIQLIRMWLSQWAVFGHMWNPWAGDADNTPPVASLTEYYGDNEASATTWWGEGMSGFLFLGPWKAAPAVRQFTDYRVRLRVKVAGIAGPREAGYDHGLVAKIGGWLASGEKLATDPGTGTLVISHITSTDGWEIATGSLTTGAEDFLPYFYIALENVNAGQAWIDYAWIEEDLGGGEYGPNVISKPWMAHHLYFEQRNSYAFDKLLELAEQHGVYLRPVILEKNDALLTAFDFDGNPAKPDNSNFYGNWREMTKVRWLQRAWWRYIQARWGYSSAIHSWELCNEGDPNNSQHYTLADELGKFMQQQFNQHPVSTSFWSGWPKDEFWVHEDYAHVDFADVHKYLPSSAPEWEDAAAAHIAASTSYGALTSGGAGKPVIRGETGFTESGDTPSSPELLADTDGIWLHNYLWSQLHYGGLLESYWYSAYHIYNPGEGLDHRGHFRRLYNLISVLPLNSGQYQDVDAVVNNENLRVVGQKDSAGRRAHLWIQNKAHTWKNIVAKAEITPESGTVTIGGFDSKANYRIQRWDAYQSEPGTQIIGESLVQSNGDGEIEIVVSDLSDDFAVVIMSAERSSILIQGPIRVTGKITIQ